MNAFTEDWLRGHEAKMARRRVLEPVDRDARVNVPTHLVPGAVDRPSQSAPTGSASKKSRSPIPNAAQRESGWHGLQRQVADYLDIALPEPLRWLHIPNGEARDGATGALLSVMGVKKGAADVLVLGWSDQTGRPSFIWIELKSATGRLKPTQEGWRDWCLAIGAPWFLCRSVDDVVEALESLGIRLKARPT